MEDKPKRYAEIFLGVLAIVVFGCAVVGASRYGLDDKVAGGLVVAALALAVLAAFSSQVEGTVKIGNYLEIPIAARRARQRLQESKVADVEDAPNAEDEGDEGWEEAMRRSARSESLPPWTGTRNVTLVRDAVPAMATLTPRERDLVRIEMERISRPDFDLAATDEMTIPRGRSPGGKRHAVPGSDITIFYFVCQRESADEPQTVDVAGIVKNLDF